MLNVLLALGVLVWLVFFVPTAIAAGWMLREMFRPEALVPSRRGGLEDLSSAEGARQLGRPAGPQRAVS